VASYRVSASTNNSSNRTTQEKTTTTVTIIIIILVAMMLMIKIIIIMVHNLFKRYEALIRTRLLSATEIIATVTGIAQEASDRRAFGCHTVSEVSFLGHLSYGSVLSVLFCNVIRNSMPPAEVVRWKLEYDSDKRHIDSDNTTNINVIIILIIRTTRK
jgi:hypothetical protein